LKELTVGQNYVLVGAPNSSDPCRPVPPTSLHFNNHFGTSGLNNAIKKIAKEYAALNAGIKLRINDMSLEYGGLFDVRNNWSSPHKGHRKGLNVDIGFSGLDKNDRCVALNKQNLYGKILKATKKEPYTHTDHYHIKVSQ
jgi:murein endopeptidase